MKRISRLFIQTLPVVAAIIACGCESTQTVQNPGALPRSSGTDYAPRLNASTYMAHGQLLERQGNFPQAAEQYRKALEQMPNSPAARNRLGVVLNKLGKHSDASAEFRTAMAHAPGAAFIQNNLGFSLYLERKFEESRAVLAACVETHPQFTRARMNFALALGQLHEYDKAFAEFAVAAGEADAHYNIAMLQAEFGELRDAATSLEAALRVNPEFEPAREQLRVIARLVAEQEAAEQAAATAQAAIAAIAAEDAARAAAEAVARHEADVAAQQEAETAAQLEAEIAAQQRTEITAQQDAEIAAPAEIESTTQDEPQVAAQPEDDSAPDVQADTIATDVNNQPLELTHEDPCAELTTEDDSLASDDTRETAVAGVRYESSVEVIVDLDELFDEVLDALTDEWLDNDDILGAADECISSLTMR